MTLLIVIASIIGYFIIAGIYYSYMKTHVHPIDPIDPIDLAIVAFIWPIILCAHLPYLPWLLGEKIYTFFKK